MGESLGTLEKLFVDDPASAFNIFKPVCIYRGTTSRPHFEIKGRYGIKRLYLAGFSNKSQWKKILGLNLSGIHVEELSIAHDDFIREMFVRVSRLDDDAWLNSSTNGGTPEQIYYKEFFDKAYINPEYNKNIPQVTLDYLPDTRQIDTDFEYIYVGFEDSPTQTEKTIERIKSMFPPGSFFFMSKVVGARGYLEGAIYAEYLNKEKHIIPYEDIFNKDKYNFIKYTIGVDVGSTDYTVFTLVGYTVNFEKAVIIDYFKINESGTDIIYSKFKEWYNPYKSNYAIHSKVHGIFFDSGGGGKVLRQSLETKLLEDYNLQSANAYKFRIAERIEANTKFIYANRLLFTSRCLPIYEAFRSAVYTKDRDKTDPRVFANHLHKDKVDSVEYGQSPFMTVMLRRT